MLFYTCTSNLLRNIYLNWQLHCLITCFTFSSRNSPIIVTSSSKPGLASAITFQQLMITLYLRAQTQTVLYIWASSFYSFVAKVEKCPTTSCENGRQHLLPLYYQFPVSHWSTCTCYTSFLQVRINFINVQVFNFSPLFIFCKLLFVKPISFSHAPINVIKCEPFWTGHLTYHGTSKNNI